MKKYTKDFLIEKAKEYDYVEDFKKDYPKLYSAIYNRKLFTLTCGHMGRKRRIRFTDEELFNIAKKYKSRVEFIINDKSAYSGLQNRKLLDIACQHMIKTKFSIPQRICKYIFDNILKEEGIYNTREIITPQEIDIYYPVANLAVEYNGEYWHNRASVKQRDNIKIQKLIEKNIHYIVIQNNTHNYNNSNYIFFYEKSIKKDIINHLSIIQSICPYITEQYINNIVINWESVFDVINWESVFDAIRKCNTLKDFRIRFPHIYRLLCRLNKLHMLNDLKVDIPIWVDKSDEYIIGLISKCSSYQDFFSNVSLYRVAVKRKLTDKAREILPDNKNINFKVGKRSWYNMDNDTFMKYVKNNYDDYNALYKDRSCYNVAKSRNLRNYFKEYYNSLPV
jgi:hypothetical protein